MLGVALEAIAVLGLLCILGTIFILGIYLLYIGTKNIKKQDKFSVLCFVQMAIGCLILLFGLVLVHDLIVLGKHGSMISM